MSTDLDSGARATTTASVLADRLTAERVVDLTVLLAEDLPCTWPGHQWFQHKTFSWFADRNDPGQHLVKRGEGGYQTRWLAIDEHTGTHLDVPSHFIPPPGTDLPHAGPLGEHSLEAVPLTRSMGPAAVIDVSALSGRSEPGTSPAITVDHVRAWEVNHGSLAPHEVVLFRSGWDRLYRRGADGTAYGWDVLVTGSRPGWPAPDADCVGYLFDRGVRCLGTDGLSVGAAEDGGPAHLAGLGRDMVFVEALTNLERLPLRGAFFMMLPLKVENGTGGPGRAIAIL